MAKRTRIIEGTWNCSSCGKKGILARHKKCPDCNNPRELTGKESEFDFGETDAKGRLKREGVTDEQALDEANAGANWFCAYCGASNRGDQAICKNCRAERTDDAKALQEEADPEHPSEGPSPRPPQPTPKKGFWTAWKVVLAVVGLGFCCFSGAVGVAIWRDIPHDTTGEITSTEWKRTVYHERFTRVTLEGWQDELRPTPPRMPVNGQGEVPGLENIRGCVRQQRSTRKVADGTQRVCSTKTRSVQCGTEEKCSTRDKGNGFKEEVCRDVPKYCSESYEDCRTETRYRDEPVYGQKCDYDTYQWKEVARQDASGKDGQPPYWPKLNAGEQDRLRQEEKYTIQISYDGGKESTTIEPKTEQEYLAWKKGQQLDLTVTNGGEVKKMLPR